MTPRIGEDFVSWKPPTGGDETLGVVDFSIFPHLDNPELPENTMADAERWAAGMSVVRRTRSTMRPPSKWSTAPSKSSPRGTGSCYALLARAQATYSGAICQKKDCMNTAPRGQPPSDRGQEASPDDLDALTAAPDHHTLLFENDRVRVLDTRIPAGDQTPLPTPTAGLRHSTRSAGVTSSDMMTAAQSCSILEPCPLSRIVQMRCGPGRYRPILSAI